MATLGSISVAKTTNCSPADTSGMRSKSRLRRLTRASQPKLRFTTQRLGSSTKPFFASGSLITCSSMPFSAASLLICPGQLDRIARGLPCLLAQRIDLAAHLLIGKRDRQRQEMAHRVNGHVHFGALAPFVAVVPRTLPAFTAALQGSAIQDDGAGLALAVKSCAMIERMSLTIASKQPASSQRRNCW